MAGIYKAVVTLRPTSGKEKDQVVNTWHFLSDPDAVDNDFGPHFDRIRDIVRDIYHRAADSQGMELFLSDTLLRGDNVHEIAITRRPADYLATGKEVWGPPDRIETLSMFEAFDHDTVLPSELAGCLSFHSSYAGQPEEQGDIRPRARRRGRIYFGPLSANAVSGSPARLSPAFVARVVLVGQRLLDASTGAFDNVHWATYSPTTHEAHRVVGGHCNDAIDIQRRRGEEESTRTLFGEV